MPHRPEPEEDVPLCRTDQDEEADMLARSAIHAGEKKWYENPLYMWGFQAIIGALVLMVGSYNILWMDNHNDSRYPTKADAKREWETFLDRYRENRENDRQDRESIRKAAMNDKQDLKEQLGRQQLQLDTISQDIKALLSRTPK